MNSNAAEIKMWNLEGITCMTDLNSPLCGKILILSQAKHFTQVFHGQSLIACLDAHCRIADLIFNV